MLRRFRDWRARIRRHFADRLDLLLENLALRHQLMVCERGRGIHGTDRLVWCVLARFWPRWREPLTLVQAATVLRWRRTSWWQHLRRQGRCRSGRPRIDCELQALIQRMATENRLWGSMRIVGELRKLGFEVSNSTVRRYRAVVRRPRGTQSWATFLHNHAPYLREALRDEMRQRTRRLLEMLLGSPPGRASGEPSGIWPIEMSGEPIGKRLCRSPACQWASHATTDPPALKRDAA